MENTERRFMKDAEVRVISDDYPVIEGYAAVFNTWTDLGYFKEKISKGAFRKTIKESDVRALWNHDPNYVLGRNKAGTLTMKEDDRGLLVEITPPDNTWSKDLQQSMKRGDINQMSFGFKVVKADDDYNKNTRVLQEVSMFDVSVVTFPAYPTTTAEVRALFEKQENKEGWKIDPHLDNVLDKMRSGEELTSEDLEVLRAFSNFINPTISEAAAKEPGETHSETEPSVATPEPEPGSEHSDEKQRKDIHIEMDATSLLLAKGEKLAPKVVKQEPKSEKWRLHQ